MILSFEIGTDSVSIYTQEGGERTAAAEISLPRATIDGGMIADTENVYRRISNELTDKGLHLRQCEFVFPDSAALTREITLPDVKDAKVMPLLKAQLEQALPDIASYVVDYIEFEPDEKDKRIMLAVMLPVKLVEQYMALSQRLNMKCVNMDLRFARLRRSVIHKALGEAYIVVDLIPGEADVTLFEDDKVFVKSCPLLEQDNSLSEWGITFAAVGQGSTEQANTLAGVVNGLVQFQTGRSRETPVENIYAAGELERYGEMLTQCAALLNRSISPLPDGSGREAPQTVAAEG